MLFIFQEAERMLKMPESLMSNLFHIVSFRLKTPKTELEKGMLIISIDIDVGSRLLGLANKGENDPHVHAYLSEYTVGKIEQMALPLFADLFERLDVSATFAIRGQLIDVDNSSLDLLLDSSVRHDIGAHGYTHRSFGNLSREEAKGELDAISASMKKIGITPRSFIFPRNSVGHLNLLEKYGYKCYRSYGNFLRDSMCIEKRGGLYNICPSLFLDQNITPIFLEKIVDIAVTRKAPLHFWFHLWNFGATKASIQRGVSRTILPLLKHAEEKMNSGLITLETMLSAAEKIEAISSS